jgi:hypothetical protein
MRFVRSGENQTNSALDVDGSFFWGPGGTSSDPDLFFGYDTRLRRSPSTQALDISFGVQGIAAPALQPVAGGTLSASQTYYYMVQPTVSGSPPESVGLGCNSITTDATNKSVQLSWTAAAPTYPNLKYSVFRSTTACDRNSLRGIASAITGTTYIDTGDATDGTQILTYNASLFNPVALRHRFYATGLGINTQTAALDGSLDVRAFDAATVGVSIKAAPSPTANLWQVKDSSNAIRCKIDSNFNFSCPQFISTAATGTAPLSVTSTTEVASLNAQQWHGKQAIDFSSTLNFGAIAAQSCSAQTIVATGAAVNNPVAAFWPVSLENGIVGMMYVSATDTVNVRLCNVTTTPITPAASQTFGGRVIK